jgi:O6-methylguanine-DNA--protein-cysteine methyltransferase
MLLGIDCGHVKQYRTVVDRMNNPHPQGWKVESNTGIAIVIPAWRLEELLNKPELVMQRKMKEHQHLDEKEA